MQRALLIGLSLLLTMEAPAFGEEFHADPKSDRSLPSTIDGPGYVLPTVNGDHFGSNVGLGTRPDKALPTAYDCRALGYVTPVKNQGACGACYAFSTAADLESKLVMAGAGVVDLSENSLKECNYQGTSCGGGNQYVLMNYLTSNGAALEACDPYVAADVSCASTCAPQYVILDWSSVSGSTIPDTAVLKQYLMDRGPLQTTLFVGDGGASAWNTTFGAYNGTTTLYYAGTETPNHSVVIVGWDDSLVHAGGTGAWICKNSWGTNWGGTCGYGTQRGYFKIAYGSASIGMWSSFIGEFMPQDPAVSVLYHDEGGYTSAWGGVGNTLWGLARHDVSEGGYLHRVEFWTTDVTPDVDVFIFDTMSGGNLSNLLASSLNHSFAEPGYHHIELNSPLALAAGQDIYIAVRFTNQSYAYPVAIDRDGPAAANRSWYSMNGSSWTSLYGSAADVTIRARTSTNTVLSLEDDPGVDEEVPAALPSPSLRLDAAWPNPFNPSTNVRYSLPYQGSVVVSIHDLQGHLVRTLVRDIQPAGEHVIAWDGRADDGRAVAAGLYVCRAAGFNQVRSIKLALLK